MKAFGRILKWTLLTAAGLAGLIVVSHLVYMKFFYFREMNSIKDELNEIEGVDVVDIWGHEDITLEEVTARLRVKGKGEIVMYGLSKDVFSYPTRVPITEIGGYSFTTYTCTGFIGIGSSIDIGKNTPLGDSIGIGVYFN